MTELMPVVMKVITNKIVIKTTIAIVLYMKFCSFVANYTQKPFPVKKRQISSAKTNVKTASKASNTEKSAEEEEH